MAERSEHQAHIDLLRIPEGLRSSGDPVAGNPFRDSDPRHAVWTGATRYAEQEIRSFNAAGMGVLNDAQPRTPDEAHRVIVAYWGQLVTGKFDIWAKRGVHVVWSEPEEKAFAKWLEHYANAWLNEVRQFFPARVGNIDWLLEELRTRLIARIEYWKSEAQRYLNQQAEDRNACVSSSAQAWDIMRDDVTLRHSLMTTGFNEQRQKDLLALNSEAQLRGNAGYYLAARIELEIRDTNERAQALYDACCEVWEIHGLKKNRAFYRAVFENCLQSVFGTRRAVVASELQHRDTVMRIPGNSSAAQGSLGRRMDQLRAMWNQKLEKEARDSDTRERVAREVAAQLLPAQMPASGPVGYQPQTPRPSNPGRKPRLSSEFVAYAGSLWRDKQGSNKRVRFSDLEWIAGQLDARKFTPPGDYLEKKPAELLKKSNSKNAHSKAGAVLSWIDLVARGEQDSIRAMKRLLSRCAGKCP